MHIIKLDKETIVFQETGKNQEISLENKRTLYSNDVLLENQEIAKLLLLEITNPEELICTKTSASIAPSMRAFMHTSCRKFIQGQLFYAFM